MSMLLMKQFPHMKAVIQDQPSFMNIAQQFWESEHPEAVATGRVSFLPIDFFMQSPVPDCDYYYLHHILHDWPDAECIVILENVRRAMKPSSKLLIHEFICRPVAATTTANAMEQAPAPLLPNYGQGTVMTYNQDIHMMLLYNARGRTVEHLADLGRRSGLKLVANWDLGEMGLVEMCHA